MTPPKKQCFLAILAGFFLFTSALSAQKHNRFDKDGKRTGEWRKYYPNKRLRYVGQFWKGKEYGTFKYYDILSSEHPTAIKTYSKTSDSASVAFYTTAGVLRSKGMMVGRKRVGTWMYYFPTGKTFSEEFYIDGNLEGEVKTYYKTGKLFEVKNYKNGLKEGPMKRYSENGILLEDVMYANDKLNGEGKYYDLKGNLKEKGIYKNNKRFGKWQFYLDGELVSDKKKKAANRFNKSSLKKNDSVQKN